MGDDNLKTEMIGHEETIQPQGCPAQCGIRGCQLDCYRCRYVEVRRENSQIEAVSLAVHPDEIPGTAYWRSVRIV